MHTFLFATDMYRHQTVRRECQETCTLLVEAMVPRVKGFRRNSSTLPLPLPLLVRRGVPLPSLHFRMEWNGMDSNRIEWIIGKERNELR